MYQAHYLTDKGIKSYLRTIDMNKHVRHQRTVLKKEEHTNNIVRLVFNYFDVPLELANQKNRKMMVIRAKQFSQFYLRREVNYLTLEAIGSYFNLDHATVLHSVRKIGDLIEVDAEYQQFNNDLSSRILELYK